MAASDDGEWYEGLWPAYAALAYIAAYAAVGTGVFFGGLAALGRFGTYVRSPVWAAAWFALVVYLAWWYVYYHHSVRPGPDADVDPNDDSLDIPERPVVTLRSFLAYNTPRNRQVEGGEGLAEKASNTIGSVGVIVGFSLLIFSFTVRILFTGDAVAGHIETILSGVLLVQIFAVANFLIGIDSLDTTMNEYVHLRQELAYRRRQLFYDRGINCYYRGLSALVFSMFLLTMIVRPLVTVLGMGVFTYYGYSYWFGYADLPGGEYVTESDR